MSLHVFLKEHLKFNRTDTIKISCISYSLNVPDNFLDVSITISSTGPEGRTIHLLGGRGGVGDLCWSIGRER